MQDGYGREIDYLRLSVTDLCNYRCVYCMGPEGVAKRSHADILSIEECVEIGRAAVACGVRKIRVTGGEPLVRRGILELCRGLREIPGLAELCLTTNGSRLEELAAPLRQAGVDRLNISLDTLRPERFSSLTRQGRLSDVLRGIAAAEEVGFQNLKLDTVLMGGFNDDEIGDFLRLTLDHPWEVRFIELMPMVGGREFGRGGMVSNEKVLEALPQLEPAGEDGGVARLYRLPGGQGNIGLISPVSHRFCARCNRIRLTADGKVKTCLHSGAEYDLKGLDAPGMTARLRRAILEKPACHNGLSPEQPSGAGRQMNAIGG